MMIIHLLEQEDVIRVVLSLEREKSRLVPSWQDIHVMESLSKALTPLAELTDFYLVKIKLHCPHSYLLFTIYLPKFSVWKKMIPNSSRTLKKRLLMT